MRPFFHLHGALASRSRFIFSVLLHLASRDSGFARNCYFEYSNSVRNTATRPWPFCWRRGVLHRFIAGVLAALAGRPRPVLYVRLRRPFCLNKYMYTYGPRYCQHCESEIDAFLFLFTAYLCRPQRACCFASHAAPSRPCGRPCFWTGPGRSLKSHGNTTKRRR